MKITPSLKTYQKDCERICKIFSRRLKALKDEHSMTLEEIADTLGISRQSIIYYIMGDRLPKVPILIQIAKMFGTSVDFLLGVSNKRW